MPTLWPIPTFGILWIIWKVLLYWRDRRIIQQHQCAPIPSYPHKDPFLGYDLHRLLEKSKQTNSLLPTIETLYRTYGNGRTFQALTWGIPTLYTTDPKNIQAVLATHFDRFGVEPIRKAFNDPWIGAGIVTSDGPLWKSSRALLKPLFAKSQFADFNKLEIHVSNLICTLEIGRGMVDLQPHFSHLYVNLAMEFLFGLPAEELLPQVQMTVDDFLNEMQVALQGVQRRVALGPMLKIAAKDRPWQRACQKIHRIFDYCIDQALIDNANPPCDPDGIPSEAAQHSFSLVQELVKETHDRKYIRDQLLSVFLPIHNASPIAISDLFFQLARHPEVWERLRKESLDIGNQPLTFEVLKSMKFLNCVIRESLRLLAPLDRVLRLALSDTVLPRGGGPTGEQAIYIKQGTLIDIRTNVLHRDTSFWGPDASAFRPDRWLQSDLRPKWEFLPFGGGARNCPANNFVLTQYGFIITKFVRRFAAVENQDATYEFVDEYNFSKRSKNGVKVRLVPGSQFD
ncbi:MAG: hypothetical protein Q9188_002994 [Gyalolechia gomerana]